MQYEQGGLCSFFFLLFFVLLLAGYTSLLALGTSMMLGISCFFSPAAFPLIWSNVLPPVTYALCFPSLHQYIKLKEEKILLKRVICENTNVSNYLFSK